MNILITGCAGFIGFHLTQSLLSKKNKVIGLDNINNYYDIKLKKDRLKLILEYSKKNNFYFNFNKIDLSNYKKLKYIFKKNKIDIVINLAAQAGVRYSIDNPRKYLNSNIVGFFNIIELSRLNNVKQFIYASTGSVYGDNKKLPFDENYNTDKPLQFYAATKKSNEVIAHSYSHLYKLKTIGLRFFTVYGPWGRPDMAYFKFTNLISKGKEINIFNNGNHVRDLTYISDVVNSIKKIILISPRIFNHLEKKFKKNISIYTPFKIYNIGNGYPLKLIKLINYIEENLKIKSKKIFLSRQSGDAINTLCNKKNLNKDFNIKFKTDPKIGIKKFIKWYKKYYS
mgnify:CR=1 FL=1